MPAPSARTASAAHTELSTPPDRPSTTPRLCSCVPTASTIQREIFSTSAAQSIESVSAFSRLVCMTAAIVQAGTSLRRT